MNIPSIDLSVYTVVNGPAAECREVVMEIHNQSISPSIEMIVVANNREGLNPNDFPGFAKWTWILLPEIHTVGNAMVKAINVAQADFVVYVEEHGGYDRVWAEEVLKAHHEGYDIVGFVLENANPSSLISWAHLYGQFGPVVAPAISGEQEFLGGHHVSYKKDFLINYGDDLSDLMEDEGALFLEQSSVGKKMFLSGEAISSHINISKLSSYVASDYFGQRSFAGTRAKIGRWSWSKRLLYILATPLIPFVRMRRVIADIFRTNRQKRLLPQILLPIGIALIAGAFGEMLGYLFGSGDSAEKRVHLELKRDAHVIADDSRYKVNN